MSAVVGDARKRTAGVRAKALEECAALLADAVETRSQQGLEERDAGYLEGWNAAASFFAASFSSAATELRAEA